MEIIDSDLPGFIASKRPTSKLCAKCQNVFDHWEEILKLDYAQSLEFTHHSDEESLKISAAAGCGLCSQFLLLPSMNKSKPVTFAASGAQLSIWKANPDNTFINGDEGWYLDLSPAGGGASFNSDDALLLYNSSSPGYQYDAADTTLVSTNDGLILARAWRLQCDQSHDLCKSRQGVTRQLPTRLLYVGDNQIRLCLSTEFKPNFEYFTLSHCWGSTVFTTLLSSNIAEFQEQISPAALSTTFRDAIYVTRFFGCQYLWVDSLCIVQNDAKDWEKEASLIASVYSNSALNIAAAGSKDGNGGLFFKRSPFWRCQIQLTSGTTNLTLDCFRRLWSHESPLSTRGWVLQERLLPRRTLHFARDQLVWECEHSLVSEIFPHFSRSIPVKDNTLSKRSGEMIWSSLIWDYTSRHLTYNKDKLVAISGLARTVQSRTKDEYLVGMWKSKLFSQLCWLGWGNDGPCILIAPYVAPTWSWASVEGRISCSDKFDKRTDSVIFVRVRDVRLVYCSGHLWRCV